MGTRLMLAVMAAGAALLASTATTAATDGPGFPEVVDLQRVSGASPLDDSCGDTGGAPVLDSEVEVHLAVSPVDPGHLLASWQQDRYGSGGAARSNVVAVSRDGGTSWTDPITVAGISTCTHEDSPYDRATDPWGAIGPDGTAYLSTMAINNNLPPDEDDAVYVSASPDGGRTWQPPATLEAGDQYLEKPVVTADPVQAGRAYAIWPAEEQLAFTTERTDDHMRFAWTEDGGATWTDAITISPDHPLEWEWPLEILALPQADGSTSLVVVYMVRDRNTRTDPGTGPVSIFSTRSDDVTSAPHGEATWSQPSRVATFTHSYVRGDVEGPAYVDAGVPSIAMGPDGTIYVTWPHHTFVGTAPGGTAIQAARSDDGGDTWTRPATIASFHHLAFLPTVAVAGDGSVGVIWYDVRGDVPGDDELTTDVWFASSADRGASWHEMHLSGPFDLRQGPQDLGGRRWFLGDYAGLVGFPTGFGAFFPMAPPLAQHGPSDAFFARIELAQAGAARVTGSGEVPAEDGEGTASFDLVVHSDGDGGLKGHLVFDDPAADVHIEATSLDSLLFRTSPGGIQCTITGQAEVTRAGSVSSEEFTARCLDGGNPPTSDSLQVDTESYSGGGALTSGNLTVHA